MPEHKTGEEEGGVSVGHAHTHGTQVLARGALCSENGETP